MKVIIFQGEKNNGFDVLYHNMKYGLDASKELSDFLRERCLMTLFMFFIWSVLMSVSQTVKDSIGGASNAWKR